MLKFIFFLRFLFFLKKKNWEFQDLLLLISLIFLIFIIPSIYGIILNNYYFDFLSFGIILLRFWICTLILIAREKFYFFKKNFNLFIFFLFFLLIFLIISFISLNLLIFYLFFEIRLIPTFYLIIGWGYQPERLQAGFYLLFYTLFASLPLLIGIFFLNKNLINLNYNIFLYNFNFRIFFYLLIIIAFLVKMPIFLVHLWLPKAHVEAPVFGSIILAGVLLKLGGYGLIRIFIFFYIRLIKISIYWIRVRIIGRILIRLNCLWQVDFKSLIAYSSVVHIGLILIAIFNFSNWRILNCYLIIIRHGLCSSGLFFLSNLSYDRSIRRRIIINKGILNLIPRISIWWFLLCSRNISAPPSLNLLREIGLLNRILNWSNFIFILLIFFSFFRARYCLYLYSFRQHGNLFSLIFSYRNRRIREFLIIFLHWTPLNLFILKREYFIFWL